MIEDKMIEGLTYATPEIFLSILAMVLLMVGVFKKNKPNITNILFALTAFGLAVTIYLIHQTGGQAASATMFESDKWYSVTAFNKGFIFDTFAFLIKFLICVVSIAVCIIAMNTKFYAGTNHNVFEFPVLMLLSIVGMFILASSNDLMAFYIGLELQSLALYVLVSINRDSEQSTESGVKYFVLGALASGIILFGSSLIYGFSGATNLDEISSLLAMNHAQGTVSPGIIFGFVLIIAGMFFKLSAVPFHMWAPDVYEGSTKTVVAFITTAPKIAALAFLLRFITSLDPALFPPFSKIIILVSAGSMIVGAFAALRQDNFKRLLSYSSIANMGYILIAVSIGTHAAIQSGLIYLIIYMVGSIGIFAIISILQKNDQEIDKISDIAGLARSNPVYAVAFAVLMFSIAGIPPMAGFFGKFFVFKEAISAGYITLSIIGVITSVVACYYYLRIIKVMYFDNSSDSSEIINPNAGILLKIIIFLSVAFTLLMIFFADDVIGMADIATDALL